MPQQSMDWDKVISLTPRGHCEIQDGAAGILIRGPIKEITRGDGGMIFIDLLWVAQMGLPERPGYGEWVKSNDLNLRFAILCDCTSFVVEPTSEHGERIRFAGHNLIYINPQPDTDASILTKISGGQN